MAKLLWAWLVTLCLAYAGSMLAQAPASSPQFPTNPAQPQNEQTTDEAPVPLNPRAETVDQIVPFEVSKVMAALKVAMEGKDCNFSESTATHIECKRPRAYSYSQHMDVGGESVTAVLEAQGEATHVHISTGKGFYGRLGKVNLSVPIYNAMMNGLQEGPAAPTTTPSVASSGEAPAVRLEDTTPVDYTHWGYDPSADVLLALKETERKSVKGHTQLTYTLEGSGFPSGQTYVLWHMQSGDHMARSFPSLSSYTASENGKLVCPEQLPPRSSTVPAPHCIPLEKLSIRIDAYHKGEPMDYAIVSTDGAVRAYARAYPFPLQAQDAKCTLKVEVENSNMTAFVIRGSGFAPNEKVATSSSFGGEAASGNQQASAAGEFAVALRAEVPGKNTGSATFTASGASCHPSIMYDWGKAAMKVQ
jgi:hypothetical protein